MLERMLSRVSVRSRLPHIAPPAARIHAVRLPLVLAIRTYATPGRPKSVVGEPSRPVKRAVKKAARTPNDGTSAAEKKIAAKTTRKPATRRPRAVTPEQAAKRQEKAEQKAARDTARAQKAAERKLAEKKKTKASDLKAAALPDAPRKLAHTSAYLAYWTETSKGLTSIGSLATKISEAAAKWKEMTPADIEHYNHIKRTANEAAAANYKQWIESHSPDEIRLANLARAQLRRENPKQKTKWAELHDERRPKRPQSAFISFSMNRQGSGDFANIKLSERGKLIAQEWQALSASEKAKYFELQKQDAARYHEEHSQVYGFESATGKRAVASAAA